MSEWTDDQIDALLNEHVGEIEPDRFDELVQQAIVEAQRPEAPLQAQQRAKQRRASGTAGKASGASATTTRWLMAAAAVVLIGFIAFAALPDNNSTEQAGRSATTSTAVQDAPASTLQPVCDLESGGGPVVPADPAVPALSERTFQCKIDATEPGPTSTVLISDGSLLADVVPASGAAGTPCVDLRSSATELTIVPGDCTGKGLRAAASVPGIYEVEFRVLTCPDAITAPEGCGAPESDYVGRIIVQVGL